MQTVNTNPVVTKPATEIDAWHQEVARQIVIHSAHSYHFLNMTTGEWQGVDGMANALAEDYADMSGLRELGRRLCAEHPEDKALHDEAARLKCFE